MTFLTVAVVTGLLLSDRSTREYGYMLLVLSALAFPALTVVTVIAAAIYYFTQE